MTTAALTPTPPNQPAATVHVGGQGHELLEGVTWTSIGALGLVVGTSMTTASLSVLPVVVLMSGTGLGIFGLSRLFGRKRVEVNPRGGAEVTRTALGVAFGGYDYDDGDFDFVSVHDVRNDRLFGTGLKQMVRDLFRPQFELSLIGEGNHEYLAMHWSRESALEAARELSQQTGLDVYDRTVV